MYWKFLQVLDARPASCLPTTQDASGNLRPNIVSVMKLMIFISPPHFRQSNGSTSQTFLMHFRHFGEGIFRGR